jgi:hypothetical protein
MERRAGPVSRGKLVAKKIVQMSSGALAGRAKMPVIPAMGQIGWEECAGKEEG